MKYLGLDWGLKRIGLAVSEGELASPWKTLEVHSLEEAVAKVKKLADEEKIELVIIGQPEGGTGKMIQGAVTRLKQVGLSVLSVDETLSTQKAQNMILKMGIGKKSRREDNAVAAAIILQQYLDEGGV